MLYLILGFDYELFFGKNYKSYDEVLFEPSERITEVLEENNVCATFFADVCSVYQHQRMGLFDYSSKFSEQIQSFCKKGQDIQLHIHPHWLHSTYNEKNWVFPKDYYRIHDFLGEEVGATEIIENGVEYLNNTLKCVNLNYKCVAYRAGGYCLQPWDDILPILVKSGIVIDSSVAMYRTNSKDKLHYYDYSKLPEDLNFWIKKGSIQELSSDKQGEMELFEVPIGFCKQDLLGRFIMGKRRTFTKGEPNGEAMSFTGNKENIFMKIIKYNFRKKMISVDNMSAKLLMLAINYIYHKYNSKNKDMYMSIIGHPKSFTGDAFNNLDLFLKLVPKQPEKYQIITMRDVYDRLKLRDL